ncbi:MAG: hypothetical protein HY744_24210 [Deltaproteobacteria bacterium]|nr:hypothetical protein [Deltaproteobacteria bacterium]
MATVLVLARPARADEEPPVRLRYPPSSVRTPVLAGGIVVAGGAYAAGAACASTWDDVPGAGVLLVPVVGPWISLAELGCAPDDPGCDAALVLRTVLTVLDGLAQAGGLGLALEGAFMTTEAVETDPSEKAGLTPAPLLGPHFAGVGLLGRF